MCDNWKLTGVSDTQRAAVHLTAKHFLTSNFEKPGLVRHFGVLLPADLDEIHEIAIVVVCVGRAEHIIQTRQLFNAWTESVAIQYVYKTIILVVDSKLDKIQVVDLFVFRLADLQNAIVYRVEHWDEVVAK